MCQAACAIGTEKPARETSCQDGRDEDGDGATDCQDPDCAGFAACGSPTETNCTDNVDNDGDGSTDCTDSDCANDPACSNPSTETNCSDNIDNDGDGNTDCADSDCAQDPACPNPSTETNCSDQVDNDSDGFTDCNDTDCANDPACQGGGGQLSCLGINLCLACCPSNDNGACGQACMGAGSNTAQQNLQALLSCAQQHCSAQCQQGGDQNACNQCVDQNCHSQEQACTWWDSPGTAGCWTTYNCLGTNCQSKNLITDGSGTAQTCVDPNTNSGLFCYQDCLGATDDDSFQKMVDMFDCFSAAMGQGGQCESQCGNNGNQNVCSSCLWNACDTEIGTCQNDG